MGVAEQLESLGLQIPEVPAPVAAYVPAVRSGNYVYTAGQLPLSSGELIATGKVGDVVTPEVAYDCARQCALNAIAAVASQVDDIDSVRIVKVVVFVASTTDFTGQPAVANGASELIGEAFGESGIHARSAVGVPVLPLDAPVEVEVIAEIQ